MNYYINTIQQTQKFIKFEIMKLIMIESDEKGIWYFTGIRECADFLGVTYTAIRYWLQGVNKSCKGWTHIEEIESDDVLSRFINPSRAKYVEIYGE